MYVCMYVCRRLEWCWILESSWPTNPPDRDQETAVTAVKVLQVGVWGHATCWNQRAGSRFTWRETGNSPGIGQRPQFPLATLRETTGLHVLLSPLQPTGNILVNDCGNAARGSTLFLFVHRGSGKFQCVCRQFCDLAKVAMINRKI
jgi:hypothetical protein